MRLGMRGWKLPPHHTTGYGLIGLGAIIMLFALPFTFYVAALGALIAYLGHTLRGR